MIRILLPAHLRELAKIEGDVELDVQDPVSVRTVLNTLEARYPMLRGTLRDQNTLERRPFIRFFACGEDISLESPDDPLPQQVIDGTELLRIVGSMAGG